MKPFLRYFVRPWVAIAVFLVLHPAAHALQLPIPDEISEELLSESVPEAFSVAPFEASDFKLLWEGAAPAGVSTEIVPQSVEWVRILNVIVLPRGRVRLQVEGVESAQILHSNGVQPIEVREGKGSIEFPVALLSANRKPPVLQIRRAGKVTKHPFQVRYSPAAGGEAASLTNRIFIDPSCFPHGVTVDGGEKLPADQWMYIGCRLIRSKSETSRISQLEAFVYWDGVAQDLEIDDLAVAPISSSFWRLQTGPHSAPFRLRSPAGGPVLQMSVRLPPKLRTAFLGGGIGPYSYIFDDGSGEPGSTTATTAPIVTMYGSYFLTETSRFVFFDAFSVNKRAYNDFGLYFSSESSRALDERLSVFLLLGFHIVSFKSKGQIEHKLGAPQGFEMILRDAFGRTKNLSVGGFFYPPIDGKAYYNAWLRIGTPKLFGEINYLSWREKTLEGGAAYSRSMGICIGAPLMFF